ncbi:putative RNA-binding protein eif1ad [Dermatophagoides pteronyssinus]|uniref:Probable RNA-binding protein EIF1AD n=1 Tax=Dermatophagoides pteronyssinus TaxID=6956 RepID=A0ABQ8J3V9_DERPT|nr:putative RNA-binding protein eif1ad [Dermatophagoides pteronyssinus]
MTEATKKKHVARELNDFYHLPDPGEQIVQVLRGCGNNLHEVRQIDGEQYLVSMPTKFRRSVWIKRGDFLIVTPIEEGNKVRAEIHSILLKDHIRYLKQQNKWPKEFTDAKADNDEIMFENADDDSDHDIQMNSNHKNDQNNHSDSESDTTDNDDDDNE